MPYFTGSRGRIHHDSWLPQQPARTVVVLLHGYGEHLGLYDPLASRLTGAGHAVHALDSLGHGRSDGERGRLDSFDDYVDDARTLVRIATEQHPGVPVILVGHSGGALAAYLLALRHPRLASGAVLSGAPLAPLDWVAAELAGARTAVGALDTSTLLSTHPDYLHQQLHDPLCLDGGFHHSFLRAKQAAWPETVAALAESRPGLPVLVVHGEDDAVVPASIARYVAHALPRASLRCFPGDLHDVLNEHDRAVVHDELLAFVEELADAAQDVA